MSKEPQSHCYYLGKSYPLYAVVDSTKKKINIEWDGKSFICTCPRAGEIDLSEVLKSFYIKETNKLIRKRIELYQSHFKVKHKSFSIENSQTKWGSCNSNRHLTFHWKLIVFPIEAIDYVVIHELCHLIHMNHGRSFWRLVGKIQPNYKEIMPLIGSRKTTD